MPSVPLHPVSDFPKPPPQSNPLPPLLRTPTGLAILEIQGTINMPDNASSGETTSSQLSAGTNIGRVVFPDYDATNRKENDPAWTKRVYLYVGKHQRLTGEVKKLPKPMAVLRRREYQDGKDLEELEIVEIVKWKVLFSQRPEPVG